ncbi:uncharacterized protein LOC134806063 [Cydia splendana]|uniref:uncharacterized protein LOC134806063 n=1 Tax=Cydia splendana TaxID=1100963 RepID=UPI00300D0403
MSSCKQCYIRFGDDEGVQCSRCGGRYHYRCCEVQETIYKKWTADKKSSWRCTACRENNDSLAELVMEIKGLKTQINSMQDGLNRTNQGINNIETKFADMERKLDGFGSRLVLVEDNLERLPSIESGLKTLETEFAALNQANENGRDQFARLNNVEISGIPQRDGENLLTVFKNITVTVGFELRETDVDTIHRVRRYPNSTSGGRAADPRPPAIIIRFSQRRRKDELVAAVRARRNLTTADAGLPGPATAVYVNEHLTSSNKLLLKRARDLKAELNYTYLWVKQCKIYMRKNDKSKVYAINSESDLAKLK